MRDKIVTAFQLIKGIFAVAVILFDDVVFHAAGVGSLDNGIPVEVAVTDGKHFAFTVDDTIFFQVQKRFSAGETADPLRRILSAGLDPEGVDFR